jgi:hypothetical protein
VGRFRDHQGRRGQPANILVTGHAATHYGLERFILAKDQGELMFAEFVWQDR